MSTDVLSDLIGANATDQVRTWVHGNHAVRVTEEIGRLDPSEQAVAFRLMEKDKALEVFERLDPEHQRTLLEGLKEERVRELVEAMPADRRARLLDEVPAKVATRLMEGLSRDQRDTTAELLGYEQGTAGRMMVPAVVTVSPESTREAALQKLQDRPGRSDEYSVLPVTDQQRRLVGIVSLSDIVTSPQGTPVQDVMLTDAYSVTANESREVAGRLIQDADLLGLPVVDSEDRVIGIITVDDAMEALEEEVTEDAYRAGGAEPLGRPYLAATVFGLARSRAVWLLVLVLAAVLTVNVLEFFEETLESMVVLALFIPLLIDTGGNAGSQAASAMIRALAVGEVRFRDLPRILWREARVGVLLGVMLAAIGFPIASIFYGTDIGLIISLTLLVVCFWASSVGGILPLIATRLKIDPAVFSAPVVTTLVDATGLIIYFLIANAVLGDQLATAASALAVW
ncbi:magnesium transporter [Nesterenkonia natronophila]|uniref:Magnesium transporter MgtE n=1 Tax=Nesterenkonia natronophila TaxID=2174932 RepID=A0A3A4F4C3_9MICC|nr:magnesium transporter [Nesterenkonia natronophila]RJN32581.1 magnesium transporter [Nesterenkonia natronophila]